MNPFDYVKSVTETKQDIMVDEVAEKTYTPFLTNRSLSYFLDTVFPANEMNRLHHLPKKAQYTFLLNTVRKKKRWAGKWHKAENNSEIELIMEYYGYSAEKARAVYDLLKAEDLDEIKRRLDPGGVTAKK